MAMTYVPGALRANLKSMDLPSNNGYMTDFLGSDNSTQPLTCGFFRMERGAPLTYKYDFDEMKLVVEGEITIADESGNSHNAVPGDIFYFSKGSEITFSTSSCATLFYCAQRTILS